MAFRFDWSGLVEILDEQKKHNAAVLKRLKALESKLAKLEKKINQTSDETGENK